MFDLNTLAIKDSTTLQLKHPVTEELLFADAEQTQPVTIDLWSQSSKQYRAAVNAMQNRQLKRGKKQPTAEAQREEGVALLVACSKSAANLSIDGEALDNADAFRKLYSIDAYGWVKTQVDEALGSVELFIEA
jgi:hypothetical protein